MYTEEEEIGRKKVKREKERKDVRRKREEKLNPSFGHSKQKYSTTRLSKKKPIEKGRET